MIILHNVPFLGAKDPSIKVYGYNIFYDTDHIFDRGFNYRPLCVKPENIDRLIYIDVIFI
ncbi:MAG: hypothetical protein CW342_10130 [Thermoactinomycetaceae bacterium]|nr:hypothetical protein [Thermoactinomycetaceae bacterium]